MLALLCHHRDRQPHDERLRRRLADGADETDIEEIIIQHFTSAWVARAVMVGGDVTNGLHLRLLQQAVREVVRTQRNGVWTWRDTDSEPIWMTYQGVVVLRDYALRNLPWPP